MLRTSESRQQEIKNQENRLISSNQLNYNKGYRRLRQGPTCTKKSHNRLMFRSLIMAGLLVHQNLPGQKKQLGLALHKRGDDVISIGGPQSTQQAPWQLIRYNKLISSAPNPQHPWAEDSVSKLLRAETVGVIMNELKSKNWTPGLVVGHSG